MPNPFLTFQRFNDPALAQAMADILKTQGIETRIENDAPVFDPSYAFNSINSDIHLNIRPADFTRAHQVLVEYYRSHLSDVDPEYYLFQFTNEELLAILSAADDWGPFDNALAERILTDRGHPLTPTQTTEMRDQRVAELSKPEPLAKKWLFLGYALLVIIPLASCIQGGIIAYYKKTLPNGERVYAYEKADRRQGKALFFIGGALQVLVWGFRIWWVVPGF